MSFLKKWNPVSVLFSLATMLVLFATQAFAGEADIILPDLSKVTFSIFGGAMGGLHDHVFRPRRLPDGSGFRGYPVQADEEHPGPLVHARRVQHHLGDLQDLPVQQGKFLVVLWVLIAVCMVYYFGGLQGQARRRTSSSSCFCSILGILGSYGVAWFGIRINTVANSRTAFSALKGNPLATLGIPLRSGMSVGLAARVAWSSSS